LAHLSEEVGCSTLCFLTELGRPGEFRKTECPMNRSVGGCRDRKTRREAGEILPSALWAGQDHSENCDAGVSQRLACGSKLADVPPAERDSIGHGAS
jgi:hypothetical protein